MPLRLTLLPSEFERFQKLIMELAGIVLSDNKQGLFVSRLENRVRALGLQNYSDYYRYIHDDVNNYERHHLVDLLTTNETFFFREAAHFEFLRELAKSSAGAFRVWSAACSSGEEAWSVAMTLADALRTGPWEVVGTDISRRVLAKARNAHYAMERIDGIPSAFLKRYCLRGIDREAGTLLVHKMLRERVRFCYSNLLQPRQDLGTFDVIFLRNVMIYFDNDTKLKVVRNLLPYLKNDGFLVTGHAESLTSLNCGLKMLRPTLYQRR
ncbi:Chemotaxis protein methyltransferase, CheR-type [gamma proteobacterium HdN1]|nr:Chemotaxis protein methyltransferase, CheR-type [gamma proteobacterium HdN1]